MSSEDANQPDRHELLRRLIRLYRRELPMTVITLLITVLGAVAELLPHNFVRMAINYMQEWVGVGPLNLWPFAVIIVLTYLIHNLLRFAMSISRMDLSTRISNSLRSGIFSACQRHSLTFHKQTTSGDLISRATADVQRMAQFLYMGVFGLLDIAVFVLGAVVMLVWINWQLALVVLVPFPIAVFLTMRLGMKVRKIWRDSREAYGDVTTTIQENIAGARVVRAFAQEQTEEDKFKGRSERFLGKVIQAIEYWVIRMVGPDFVFGLVMPVAVLYGGMLALAGRVDVGDIFFCFSIMQPIQRRLREVMQLVDVYQRAAAASERVFEVLDEEPSIRSNPGAKTMPPSPENVGASVVFEDVSFGYEPYKPVLRDICFEAKPGTTTAIVGHTGSGKSTLISLIPRFHDPVAGRVLLNGADVRDIRLEEVRREVGIIFQETFLFSASVRENIAYGRPEASMDAIRKAAKAARAHDFILGLEDGYDTVIGERGETLSGGQAQRIAIARAILLDPCVLIMDDATAAVDSETERLIRETMKRVSEGRTNFIIAHRISSVAHADQILVLEDGRIAESGTHAELYAMDGIYRRICDQQFGVLT